MLPNGQSLVTKGLLKETEQMNKDAKELEGEISKRPNPKSPTTKPFRDQTSKDYNPFKKNTNKFIEAALDSKNLLESEKENLNEELINNYNENNIDNMIENTTQETMCPTSPLCNTYSNLNVSDFGYLKNDENTIVGSYVNGTETSPSVINNYIHNDQTGTYNGTIYGTLSGNNIGTSTTEGTIQLNMDFGDKSFDGNMVIYNGNWQVNIADGSISAKGFSSETLSGTAGSDTITFGNIDGNYYGSSAEAAAGTFKVLTDTQQVVGVFGSKK